jgi:putative intracellular protease/amidase
VEVAILLHEGVSAVEALGSRAVFGRVPNARVQLVAAAPGRISTHDPSLAMTATTPISAVARADVLVIPGGFAARYLVNDEGVVAWVRTLHAMTQWTAAISTGALVLAAAGLVAGVDVAAAAPLADELAAAGARPVPEPVVEHGRIITATGGRSAVELGLTVASHLGGRSVADRIRTEVGDDDLAEAVPRWHHEAESSAAPPSRWHRLVQRTRHGSVVVIADDTPRRSDAPHVPKGWRGPRPIDGSVVDE